MVKKQRPELGANAPFAKSNKAAGMKFFVEEVLSATLDGGHFINGSLHQV